MPFCILIQKRNFNRRNEMIGESRTCPLKKNQLQAINWSLSRGKTSMSSHPVPRTTSSKRLSSLSKRKSPSTYSRTVIKLCVSSLLLFQIILHSSIVFKRYLALAKVSGIAKPGSLLAIMGLSGAGLIITIFVFLDP